MRVFKEVKNLFFLSIFIFGCTNLSFGFSQNQQNASNRQKPLLSVNIKDGIDKDEAMILSNEYFVRYISGCGGISNEIEHPDHWEMRAVEGIAAQPLKHPIIIDKKSGTISLEGYPTIKKPLSIWLKKIDR